MGYDSAKAWGVDKPPMTLDDSIEGCLKQVSLCPSEASAAHGLMLLSAD